MTIDKNRFSAALVWLSITLFYCYQYLLRILPNIIMPELTQRFGVGTTEFGIFAGIYYIGYIVVHIPVGVALSRISSRLVLPPCILLTALGLIPVLSSAQWNYLLLGRLFTGMGSSAAIVGALQLFRLHFPQHFTRMLGGMVFCGLITVVYASQPLNQLLSTLGIKSMITMLIAMGVGLGIVSFFLLPQSIQHVSKSDLWKDIKLIVGNKKLVGTSLLAGLMVGPLEGFSDAWGSAFIQAVHGIDRETSSAIVASLFTGMAVGCTLLPYWADKTRAYYSITLLCALAMTGCFIYLTLGYGNAQTLNMICLIIGLFCAYQVVIMSKITSFVPDTLNGIAGSVINMIVMAFGPLFHNAIGISMDRLWSGEIAEGVRIYPKSAYLKGIAIIPGAMIIAIVGFIFIMLNEKMRNKQSH